MNLQALTQNRTLRLLKTTFDGWMEDNALRLSAALAYYSIFSIAPLLVIAISIAGLVLGDEAVRDQVKPLMQAYVGPQAAEAVQSMIQSASKPSEGWIGTVVGFVTLLIGASGVFGQLKDALNTIWEVKVESIGGVWGFVRGRLLNFGMVLIIGFLLLTSLLLSTALAAFTGYLQHLIGLPPFVGVALGFVVSFGVVAVLFAFIFKVLPDVQVEWRQVWTGAIVTALLFEVGKFGLGFYLGRESTSSSFGAAGSVVLLLLWVYYASCILLFGAEFTQAYARATGHSIRPAPGAVPVTAETRAQEGIAVSISSPKFEIPVVASLHPARVSAVPEELNPLRMILIIMAGAFFVGLLTRQKPQRVQSLSARLREDFADLGEDGIEQVEALWRRISQEAKKTRSRWKSR